MQNRIKKKSPFRAGVYLLETLTSGMYNEPLSIYREYLQNSVDSIDLMIRGRRSSRRVNIDLEPIERRIRILDNAIGIPAEIAEQTLSSIGTSDKRASGLRGFRGIGRLGGIAFSDRAVFRTKAENEEVESIQEWDCKELRRLLAGPRRSSMHLKQVFKRITAFYQKNAKRPSDSYFEVILEGVSSFRNYTLDIQKVRNYLSQVAPVPFHPNKFSHGQIINNYLSENLTHYSTYEILLNGEPIYKPYQDEVKITNKGFDHIDNIKLLEIDVRDKPVGHGWYGERRDLLGAIVKGDVSSRIRIRVGNILLGDPHLLDRCFRELRFNGYVIGEIHVDCPDLIPNGRRDDFIDNEMKTLFYNAVERDIGLPLSKEIRLRSRLTSEFSRGSSKKRNQIIPGAAQASKILSEMIKSCEGCPKLSELLSKITR